jgi:hypothetical protein
MNKEHIQATAEPTMLNNNPIEANIELAQANTVNWLHNWNKLERI